MVSPIAIAVGAQALGTLAQAWQAERARGAAQDRLDRIESLFNSLKPPEYDLSVMDAPEYISTAIPEPEFDYSRFTPEMYEIVGQYEPELAPYIQMEAPQLAELGEVGEAGVEAQRRALEQMIRVSEGEDPLLQARMSEAARRAQQEAGAREASILQGAARRGALTSGLTAAAQMQSGAAAMDRLAGATTDAAAESYRQALNAMAASGQLGGQMAQQEFGRSQSNVDVINQFNQMTSAQYQNYLQERARQMNEAQLRNLGEEQRVGEANVQQRNVAALQERARRDELAQDRYMRQLAERDYQNKLLERQATFRQGERERAAGLQSQAFRDQLAKAQGQAGIGQTQIGLGMQTAQDRGRMIQGATDLASDYAKYKTAQDQAKRDEDFRNRLLDLEQRRTPYG